MENQMARDLQATVEAYEDEEPMTVGEALDAVFRKYATFGRSKLQAEREQDYLSSSSLLKLMKDCHLIDRALTITDLDLIFTRCLPQKYHKRLDMEGFHAALFDVAVQRQMVLPRLQVWRGRRLASQARPVRRVQAARPSQQLVCQVWAPAARSARGAFPPAREVQPAVS